MKLELSYIAINLENDPPILTTGAGFQIRATASSLEHMKNDCETIVAYIKAYQDQVNKEKNRR